ncbi:MAG: phospholipid carrier-dependent glycosyltransferase [Chthoniobacteraceae bacterium]
MTSRQPATRNNLYLPAVAIVLALGIALRIYPSSSYKGVGFDEGFYQHYVSMLNAVGLIGYPKISASYLAYQRGLTFSVLPPMRFLYIFTSHLWSVTTHADPMTSLHDMSCLFTILTLPVSYLFARRLGGKWIALGVLALVCCAPTQIHMSQHAMVDGVFSFWALLCLWLLWENLQRPNHPGWLFAWGFALVCMVMTKENAFFAYVAMGAIVIANRWLRFGTVNARLLATMFLGPLLGVLALVALAGGFQQIIAIYQQSVSKNYTLPYAIATGDGPWHRYLSDILLISPVVLLLALGELFQLRRDNKGGWFLVLFITSSYLIMCNIKYGMNLRYTIMWDMPLRYLAVCQLYKLGSYFGARKNHVVLALVVALCLVELREYYIFFVQHDLYELSAMDMLHATNILK